MGVAGLKKERIRGSPVKGYVTEEEKLSIFSFKYTRLCFFNLLRDSTVDTLRQDIYMGTASRTLVIYITYNFGAIKTNLKLFTASSY
jgi:hypothetical protein